MKKYKYTYQVSVRNILGSSRTNVTVEALNSTDGFAKAVDEFKRKFDWRINIITMVELLDK